MPISTKDKAAQTDMAKANYDKRLRPTETIQDKAAYAEISGSCPFVLRPPPAPTRSG